jgi:hypothetical protein
MIVTDIPHTSNMTDSTLYITITPEGMTPQTPYVAALYQQQLAHPDPITFFKGITSINHPHLDKVMGKLNGKVSPNDFSHFCEQFAAGMDYVREKYGTQPSAVILRDEGKSRTYCDRETCAVILSREMIEEHIQQGVAAQIHTDPFLLDAYQMAFFRGVEEAFHVHQRATRPEYYAAISAEDDKLNIASNSPDYDKQRVEAEARDVVRQAMIDTGIVHTAPVVPVNIDPESMQWAAPYLRERTTPAVVNNITPFARVVMISADGVVTSHPEPVLATPR